MLSKYNMITYFDNMKIYNYWCNVEASQYRHIAIEILTNQDRKNCRFVCFCDCFSFRSFPQAIRKQTNLTFLPSIFSDDIINFPLVESNNTLLQNTKHSNKTCRIHQCCVVAAVFCCTAVAEVMLQQFP